MTKGRIVTIALVLLFFLFLGLPVSATTTSREFILKQAGAEIGTSEILLSEDQGVTQLQTLVKYPGFNLEIATKFTFSGNEFPKTPVDYSFSLIKGGILDFNMTWDDTAQYSIAQLGQSFQLPVLNVLPLDNNVISDYMVATWLVDKASDVNLVSNLVLPIQILQTPNPLPMTVSYIGEEQLGSYLTDQFQVDLGVKVDIWVDQSDRSLVKLAIPMQAYEIIATDLNQEPEPERVFADFGGLQFSESTFTIEAANAKLSGTVTIPENATSQSLPIAIIIAGSGPTDRDGNSYAMPGPIDNLKEIAHYLGSQGVAAVRFDKRGIGESPGVVSGFQNYIDDIALLVDLVQSFDFVDSKQIYLIGHSEGAWLASEVAATNQDVTGLIALSGAGFSYYDTIKRQLLTQTDAAIAAGMFDPQLSVRTEQALEDMYSAVIAEDISQYNIADYQLPAELEPTIMSLVLQADIIKDWLVAEPAESLSKVTVPVLIIQGTADSQILVTDAYELASVLPEEQRELYIIEGVDHILKMTYGVPLPYTDPDRRVDLEILEIIGDWIQER